MAVFHRSLCTQALSVSFSGLCVQNTSELCTLKSTRRTSPASIDVVACRAIGYSCLSSSETGTILRSITSLSRNADVRHLGRSTVAKVSAEGNGSTIDERLLTPQTPSEILEYVLPKDGILSRLPVSWVPYVEVGRYHSPQGPFLLYLPSLYGTLLAAVIATPITPPLQLLTTNALLFIVAALMKGAACTFNDLLDRDLDRQVARTRLRPIARGAISPQSALIYAAAQLLLGIGFLSFLPGRCLFYGIPFVSMKMAYPLAKRVTNYPQVVLAVPWAWGAIMGFPAVGIDILSSSSAIAAAGCLYASNFAWTVLYEIIYSHQDVTDDIKVGIKSMVVKHRTHVKFILVGLMAIQVAFLAASCSVVGAPSLCIWVTCFSATATLGYMIWKVNLNSPKDCSWWFGKGNGQFTGSCITIGLLSVYLAKLLEVQGKY